MYGAMCRSEEVVARPGAGLRPKRVLPHAPGENGVMLPDYKEDVERELHDHGVFNGLPIST